MDKSSRLDIPLEVQRESWNKWNALAREKSPSTETNQRVAKVIQRWIKLLNRKDLSILEIGCGTGWLSEILSSYGNVTGIDLADEVLERARQRLPHIDFIAGSIFDLKLESGQFDLVVTMDVLSHIADKPAFIERTSNLLKDDGCLMIATQNCPVFEHRSDVGGPNEGEIRQWVNAKELRALLLEHFNISELISVQPAGDQGIYRLINSTKLNNLLSIFLSKKRIERLKEKALLGRELLALSYKNKQSTN